MAGNGYCALKTHDGRSRECKSDRRGIESSIGKNQALGVGRDEGGLTGGLCGFDLGQSAHASKEQMDLAEE